LQFSHIINTQIGITEELVPYLLEIADRTNETVFMGIPDGKNVMYLYSCQNNVALRRNNIMGETAPMYCTGLGKAMLAKLKDKMQIEAEELVKFTENTITDLDKLNDELDIIRSQGYAFDNMEHEYGVRCVGVAICDLSGNVVAGISVSGPSLRFEGNTPQEIAEIIKQVVKPLNHYII
jgi:DNA-binding IclR family transcriptional regulator